MVRTCAGVSEGGGRCRQAPIRGQDYCFWHHPDLQQEAQEARRLGGLRRRREKTVQGAYEMDGLATVQEMRRIIEIAILDTLSLENSVARNRVLIAGVQAASKLLEVGELEERMSAVENLLAPRLSAPAQQRYR